MVRRAGRSRDATSLHDAPREKPLLAGQPYNAERVDAIGAGLSVPHGERGSGALRNALSRVLAEGSFRAVARKAAGEIATMPLIDDAAAAMESFGAGRQSHDTA
ncbi:MAG TPA: nucleotide disphospho-sugar-binding domain-containing protein [Polyangiaceae bacterium]|nr:nucleotide disphospho-sugar-binding domain-containing protein [Polyangiaceae bacterium]